MINNLSGHDHRTLLVIDARGGFNSNQQNRVNRLLESVNGDNIKVDIAHLDGNTAATAGKLLAINPGLPSALYGETVTAEPITPSVYEEIVAAAKSLGYTQVLISVTP